VSDPDEGWCELARSALTPLGGQVFDPTREIAARSLTPRVVELGRRLWLMPDRGVNNSTEPVTSLDPDSSLETPQQVWLFVVLRLFLRRWRAGQGEPLLEAQELFASWAPVGEDLWAAVRPRGLDSVFIGRGAIRRFIGRVERVVALHQPAIARISGGR